MNWKARFSGAAERVADADAVRAILELAERPGILSLAGGMPDPAVFRVGETREAMERVLRDHARESLNYSPNPGITPLREFLAERMERIESVPCRAEEVLVVSGGVEGIRHVTNALLDPGDPLLVEDPTYMVALQIARELGAAPVPVRGDRDGPIPESLDEVCAGLTASGRRPRLLYANPTFSNPTGRTWSLDRRRKIIEVAERRGLVILEDHAYAELGYERPAPPALKALAPDRVILVHTFSKIFGPGLRLGWVVAKAALIRRLGLLKLGTDQCSGALVQRLALAYGEAGGIRTQVERSRPLYRRKRDLMLEALAELPTRRPIERPGGGFFVWVEIGRDPGALLLAAIRRFRVAFVAGDCFFTDPASPAARRTLRLSFSQVAEPRIPEAVARLVEAVRDA